MFKQRSRYRVRFTNLLIAKLPANLRNHESCPWRKALSITRHRGLAYSVLAGMTHPGRLLSIVNVSVKNSAQLVPSLDPFAIQYLQLHSTVS